MRQYLDVLMVRLLYTLILGKTVNVFWVTVFSFLWLTVLFGTLQCRHLSSEDQLQCGLSGLSIWVDGLWVFIFSIFLKLLVVERVWYWFRYLFSKIEYRLIFSENFQRCRIHVYFKRRSFTKCAQCVSERTYHDDRAFGYCSQDLFCIITQSIWKSVKWIGENEGRITPWFCIACECVSVNKHWMSVVINYFRTSVVINYFRNGRVW